jgi:hypothetical protein
MFYDGSREDLEEQRPLLKEDSKKTSSKAYKIDISALPIGCTIVLLFLVSFISYEAVSPSLFSFQNFQATDISPQSTCPLADSQSSSQPCTGKFVTFYTKATSEGQWPSGLSWNILSKSGFGDHLSRVYEENGAKATSDEMCSFFSRSICLDSGNYMLFVDSPIRSANTVPYVNICEQLNRVNIGEALDFDTTKLTGCASAVAAKLQGKNEIYDTTPVSDSEETLPDEKPAEKSSKSAVPSSSAEQTKEIFDSTPVSDSEETLPDEKPAEKSKGTASSSSTEQMKEIFDSTPVSDSEETLPEESPVTKEKPTKETSPANEIFDTTPVTDSEESLPDEPPAPSKAAKSSVAQADNSGNEIFDSTPVSDSEEKLPDEKPVEKTNSKVSPAAMNEIFDSTPVSDADEELPVEKAANKQQSDSGINQMALKLIASAQQLLSSGTLY